MKIYKSGSSLIILILCHARSGDGSRVVLWQTPPFQWWDWNSKLLNLHHKRVIECKAGIIISVSSFNPCFVSRHREKSLNASRSNVLQFIHLLNLDSVHEIENSHLHIREYHFMETRRANPWLLIHHSNTSGEFLRTNENEERNEESFLNLFQSFNIIKHIRNRKKLDCSVGISLWRRRSKHVVNFTFIRVLLPLPYPRIDSAHPSRLELCEKWECSIQNNMDKRTNGSWSSL